MTLEEFAKRLLGFESLGWWLVVGIEGEEGLV